MLAFINGLSPMHLMLVALVALLLFGNRLPDVARSIGRSINEFKKGMREVNDEIDTEKPEPEKLKPGASQRTESAAAKTAVEEEETVSK